MKKLILLLLIFILHFLSEVTNAQTIAPNPSSSPSNATSTIHPVLVQTSSGNSSITTGSSMFQNVTSKSQNQTMSNSTSAVATSTVSSQILNVTSATVSNNNTVTNSVETKNGTKMWTLPPEHVTNVTDSMSNSTNSGAISSMTTVTRNATMVTKSLNFTMATESPNITMATESPNVTMTTELTYITNSTTNIGTTRPNTTVSVNSTTTNPPNKPTTKSASNSTESVPHSTASMLNTTTPMTNSSESLKNSTESFWNTTTPMSNLTVTTPIPITNLTEMPVLNTTESVTNPAHSNVTKPLMNSTTATPPLNLTTAAPNVTSPPNNQTIPPNITQQTIMSVNLTTVRLQTTANLTTVRLQTTANLTTVRLQTISPMPSNTTTNTTETMETGSPLPVTSEAHVTSTPPAETIKPLPGLVSVKFVVIVIDDKHNTINGPTVQFTSQGINTISIPLKNSSHILHTIVNVKEGESIVVMVTKPGYATNAVRVIPRDNIAEIVAQLAKLQPASISLVKDTVHIETPKNENGLTATIQFPKSSTKEMENISADCLLVTAKDFLPDLTSASNSSETGTRELLPYAALQLNVYNGSLEITMGNFTMILPVNEKESKLEEGDKIPAWYFDENAGIWKKSGTGVLQKMSKSLYWNFTAPHLSWWMAAEQEEVTSPKKGGELLLGNMSTIQFIMIMIIACLGVFGIGAMIVFVCVTPRVRKVKGRPVGQNGSTRSNRDSEAQMTGASSTDNLELKDSSESFPDPPELSVVGMVNKGYPESSHV